MNAYNMQLQTHDPEAFFRLNSVIKFGDGSGYNGDLLLNSNGFSCDRKFYFSEAYLERALINLEKMDVTFQGEAVLGHDYEDSEIKITINKRGQVSISGKIVEHSVFFQTLHFGFFTDQTVIRPLIADLKRIQCLEPTSES